MADEKPVHIPREKYPELIYPIPTTPAPTGSSERNGIDLLDYWQVIVSRRWTVLAVLLTTVMGTLLWTFKQTPIYRATVTIQIDRENANILTFQDVYEVETTTDDTLRTQFEVLRSRSLARRVIEELHLDKNDEFVHSEPGLVQSYGNKLREFFFPAGRRDQPDPLRAIIDEYLGRVQVTPVRQARLATVTFESRDPALAARVINAHARLFIEQNFQFKWEATQQATDFLSQQLVSLKSNLEKAEDRLQAYSRANQILFTDDGRSTATEKLKQLEEEYTRAQGDRFAKESYDRLIRSSNGEALPQLMNSQLISTLSGRLTELQREDSELSVTFAPEYPRRKRTRSQIEEIDKAITAERQRITKTIQAEYAASVERETLLMQALDKQRDVVNRLNQEIIQYNILKREVDSNKQLYDGLLTRLKEAGISAGLRASNIRIVDPAEPPDSSVRPQKVLNLALSIFAGLLVGTALVFFQDYIDDSIKNSDDINRYLNISTLGIIPKLSSLVDRRAYAYFYGYTSRKDRAALASRELKIDLISHEAPASLMAEAYRSIRTSLLLSSPDHPPKLVLVTSAVPSEGKTVTATNIAISLTQTGARVVLLDADMRKPRVHTVFGIKETVGLSSILTGAATVTTAIQQSQVPNLFVIPCGVLPPNPGELILSNRFGQLLRLLPQYFDYVILDSPPVSNVSDARVVASMCDATILVVKGLSTSRRQARLAIDHLLDSRTRIAGAVLNDVDVRTAGSYYSHYYSAYAYSHKSDSQAS